MAQYHWQVMIFYSGAAAEVVTVESPTVDGALEVAQKMITYPHSVVSVQIIRINE